MDATAVLSMLTNGEFLFWLVAFAAALHARLYRGFLAVVCFLAVKLSIAGVYSVAFGIGHPTSATYVYFFRFYWIAYFLATIAVFFSIEQIIREVLSPLSGLSKLGVIIFRFTGGLALFVALTAHLSEMGNLSPDDWIRALFVSFGLCMCVFEIALMSLLMVTAHRMGLSVRTRIFGLSLGFCLLSVLDTVSLLSAVATRYLGLWAGSLGVEVATAGALLMWVVYFLLPDQPRGKLKLTSTSTLMRWNEIVNQLGPGPQPVLGGDTSFMSDVELLVERIMLRNARGKS